MLSQCLRVSQGSGILQSPGGDQGRTDPNLRLLQSFRMPLGLHPGTSGPHRPPRPPNGRGGGGGERGRGDRGTRAPYLPSRTPAVWAWKPLPSPHPCVLFPASPSELPTTLCPQAVPRLLGTLWWHRVHAVSPRVPSAPAPPCGLGTSSFPLSGPCLSFLICHPAVTTPPVFWVALTPRDDARPLSPGSSLEPPLPQERSPQWLLPHLPPQGI